MRILAAGTIPPNPSELLGSKAMGQLLQKLSAEAMVIIDAPPLLPVTDAAVLAAKADGAFVVVSSGKTHDAHLETALNNLDAVDAKPLGVILNRLSKREAGTGYYGDYYGYSQAGKRRSAE
jgi:Mrp family chromosome partitioning ATPase